MDDEKKIPYPNVRFRHRVYPIELHKGSIVAFERDEFGTIRTGIIVMESPRFMKLAYNMYDEEGYIWVEDNLPEEITLYEANEEEILWGLKEFMNMEYCGLENHNGYSSFITFIDKECPKDDDDYVQTRFCRNMLTRVPMLLERSKWGDLRESLTKLFRQTGGLQFNRFQAEYYCFLIGILMIAEYSKDEAARLFRTELFVKEWDQFSWMYGIGIGRIIGSRLHNFTGVVNQARNNNRKYYLHLYLPLVEYYFDKIIEYNDDKPEKLRLAIDKAKKTEGLEEQKTDLDELFGILFPQHLQDIMSSSRPARTIAKMRKEMEAKERRIKELEDAVDDLSHRYDEVLAQLTNAVNDVESDKISADDLTAAFLRFPTELALTFFGSLSTLLTMNPTWQKYALIIQEKILAKQKNQQDRQEQRQDKMMDSIEKAVNKPTTQNNVTLELVQKKETNIDKNYGPNIENNGTLSLPDNK